MFNFLIKTAEAIETPTGPIVKCGLGHLDSAGKEIPCDANAFIQLLHDLINYAIYIGITAVGVAVVFAGAMLMLSAGSAEKAGQGKKAITAAIVGLIITLTAWIIVNTIISFLLPSSCSGQWNIFGSLRC